MRLQSLLLSLALPLFITALAIERKDADFENVRTRKLKDMSGKAGDPREKYFHESVFHPHYDGRFADRVMNYQESKLALQNLIQSYLATFQDLGIETWLMHGSLLGWWWNRKSLPWDSDCDVQITEPSIEYLALYYNMSVFHYRTPRIPEGRDYMLEINPNYKIRDRSDRLNMIDARYIDTASGLFIDITVVRYNESPSAGPDVLVCKDNHVYNDTDIFPLRDTYFEGVPAKIPFAYKAVLAEEYKEAALTNTAFEHHRFDSDKHEWIPILEKSSPKVSPHKAPATQPENPPVHGLKKDKKVAGGSRDKKEQKKAEPQKQERQKQLGLEAQAVKRPYS